MREDLTLEQISDTIEYNDINGLLSDERVEKALIKLTSILGKPEIHPANVAKHIVECEALAADFSIKAKYYRVLGKDEPDAAKKKEFYYTLSEQFHNIAASLKYVTK